ncbi:biotin--[acetyl-CoA-carboxylase] ligase [Aestuariivita boseongensis]|uniref:biotin--[acetyl-CoA-carboxylase] ligase n=1 Tax=Aestuariivita boseongensis TaxID=1470562 RepID=UPI0006829F6F|nr:biotin--[acetyl-CoA-carboxylase] ligase [Aestuariivita boseongensis]
MTDWPQGYGLQVLEEVDSTLNEAARIAPGLSGPVWIMARRQTAARGRRGRPWIVPEGNLSATLVMRPEGGPETAALRSFVAALALYDSIADVTGRTDGLALKWPNDVLLNGGKLAGILLESAGSGGGLGYLAIGIGVNLADAPPVEAVEARAVRPVSLAGETGVQITPDDFLSVLATHFDRYERQMSDFGFAPIRTAWLARAAKLGEVITARTGQAETTGVFRSVDSAGNLVLETAQGAVSIPAAEIFF